MAGQPFQWPIIRPGEYRRAIVDAWLGTLMPEKDLWLSKTTGRSRRMLALQPKGRLLYLLERPIARFTKTAVLLSWRGSDRGGSRTLEKQMRWGSHHLPVLFVERLKSSPKQVREQCLRLWEKRALMVARKYAEFGPGTMPPLRMLRHEELAMKWEHRQTFLNKEFTDLEAYCKSNRLPPPVISEATAAKLRAAEIAKKLAA